MRPSQKCAKMRQNARTGAAIRGGRGSAQIRASGSPASSPVVLFIRSSLERMKLETDIRGTGRQLIAWHSSPYPIWSAAGPRGASGGARWPSSVHGVAPECRPGPLSVAAPRGRFPSAQRVFPSRHTEHAPTGMTGVDTAMELNSALNMTDRLADRFSQLWADGVSTPDVFAFLSSHPDVLSVDRLEVLLVDQEQRWRRGKALPLRIYLSAFSDIAANGELVRALVDGDRRERRRAAGRHDGAALRIARPCVGGPDPAQSRPNPSTPTPSSNGNRQPMLNLPREHCPAL